jgi:pyruvate dehydrogenase E1 component beta subunit
LKGFFSIKVQVINLRTLRPLDFDTVAESIGKTRRCVTVEFGWPMCGIGAEIAARVFESGLAEQLLSPVIRVTGEFIIFLLNILLLIRL